MFRVVFFLRNTKDPSRKWASNHCSAGCRGLERLFINIYSFFFCLGFMSLHLIHYFFPHLGRWITCRAPVHPRGWPRAMAPPLGFNLATSNLSALAQCTA